MGDIVRGFVMHMGEGARAANVRWGRGQAVSALTELLGCQNAAEGTSLGPPEASRGWETPGGRRLLLSISWLRPPAGSSPVHPNGRTGSLGVLDVEPLCAPLLGAAHWAGPLVLGRQASFTKWVKKWRKTHKVQRKPEEAAPEADPFLAELFPYPDLSSPLAGTPAKAPGVPLPHRDTEPSAI